MKYFRFFFQSKISFEKNKHIFRKFWKVPKNIFHFRNCFFFHKKIKVEKKLGHSFDVENRELSIGEVFRAILALCREVGQFKCRTMNGPKIEHFFFKICRICQIEPKLFRGHFWEWTGHQQRFKLSFCSFGIKRVAENESRQKFARAELRNPENLGNPWEKHGFQPPELAARNSNPWRSPAHG